MASVTIQITRAKIYSIAEGISVTISQHNGGVPAFDQLWASPSEAPKLDIHYREAVSDLERKLIEWLVGSSAQFDLSADGSDYTLTLAMDRFWPSRLEGLLDNKVQDYLVHAVTAGWLNDFEGLNVKADYAAMAAQDLSDIRTIIYQRSFGWEESARTSDSETKEDGISPTAETRTPDTETKEDGISPTAETRTPDTETKEDGISPTAGERTEDVTTKEDGISPTAGRRRTDHRKNYEALPADPISRKKDDVIKPSPDSVPAICRKAYLRHRDNAVVEHPHDYTDWSGTDFGRLGSYPPKGMRPGYYPHRHPQPPVMHPAPCPPPPHHHPHHKPCPIPPDLAMPSCHHSQFDPDCPLEHPHNPHEHVTCPPCGQHDSTDMSEEKYIGSHICGHHDCGHHGVNRLDWDNGEDHTGEEELDDATFTKNR